MDFNKDTIIELKDLETNIKISDLVYVDIKNLSKIYPYSKLLKRYFNKRWKSFFRNKR